MAFRWISQKTSFYCHAFGICQNSNLNLSAYDFCLRYHCRARMFRDFYVYIQQFFSKFNDVVSNNNQHSFITAATDSVEETSSLFLEPA